jgi:hypothetical protein
MSISWWFDPFLESISPKLAFLRKVPQDAGARLFEVPTSEEAVQDAIKLSGERAKLYEAGKYRPKAYLLAWAREDLLGWSEHFSFTSGARR